MYFDLRIENMKGSSKSYVPQVVACPRVKPELHLHLEPLSSSLALDKVMQAA
jgi:hypothetical protein